MIPEQICYVELLFTIIDRKILPKSMTDQMYDKTCDVDMKVYLTWLLNRWVFLRDNDNHYPKKIDHQKLVIKKKKTVRFNV
jgi:pantothenate kinase